MVLSKLSFQNWPKFVRTPIFAASLVSVALHGIAIEATPLLSEAVDDEPQEQNSVGVVALSPQELARLPDFGPTDGLNFENFASSAVTQEGLAALPVPGGIPLGDEEFPAFDGGLLDLLPPTPLETDTFSGSFDGGLDDGFDYSSDSFGSPFDQGGLDYSADDFSPPFDTGSDAFNTAALPSPTDLTSPSDLPTAPVEPTDLGLCPSGLVDPDPLDPVTDISDEALNCPDASDTAGGPKIETLPLPSGPIAANTDDSQDEGFQNEDFQNEGGDADSQTPNSLPDQQPDRQPDQQPDAASQPQTLEESIIARRNELRAIRTLNRGDGTVALGPLEFLEQLENARNALPSHQLKPKQSIFLTLPEEFYECEDVRAASFSLLVPPEGGSVKSLSMDQSSGFEALNELAKAEVEARANELKGGEDPESQVAIPGLYHFSVDFEEPEGGCVAPPALS